MNPILDNNRYPVFEANQVLTSEHLNDIFNYLDEQQRLTRANLIGIGIVCGLDIAINSNADGTVAIDLAKGAGITSLGYLIVEPADKTSLGWYRDYQAPNDIGYAPFTYTQANAPTQYKLWELLAKDELDQNNYKQLDPDFLKNKVVLLFLELKKQGLRNCSINNCDDKGAEVTSTIKRLLIDKDDLGKIMEASRDIDASSGNYETTLLVQLNLDDLRLPRFDVPSSGTVSSNDILAAFLTVFKNGELVSKTAKALSDAYNAFMPLLQDAYPTDPFNGFNKTFGFLEKAPATMDQVRFLQYYYDFFDDLIRAYDEFRWKGVDLICTCCPSGELFPRHLMLGYADANSGDYRQEFLASSAITGCVEHTRELNLMFQRLVEMVNQFTDSPNLPRTIIPLIYKGAGTLSDPQIRITPSVLGAKNLADKAIPYYYQQSGKPPLYQLWSIEKRRQKRSGNNLGYRYDEYVPPAPPFVSEPLRFDLEPYNFLRIEGHLGKNYQLVLGTLLSLKNKYRLPIEVVALRSGVFDESVAVDLSKESCRFQDLEALYDALREELLTSLCEGVMQLYDIPLGVNQQVTVPTDTPPVKTGPVPVVAGPQPSGPQPVTAGPVPVAVETQLVSGPQPVTAGPIQVPIDTQPIKVAPAVIAESATVKAELVINKDLGIGAAAQTPNAELPTIPVAGMDLQKAAVASSIQDINATAIQAKNLGSLDISALNIPLVNLDTTSVVDQFPGGKPELALLKTYAPNYLYLADTVGAWHEKYLSIIQAKPYIDVNQNHIDTVSVLTVYCQLFSGIRNNLPTGNYAHIVAVYYFSKLADILPASLDALAYADFENKYQDLLGLVRFFRTETSKITLADFQQFIPQDDLIDLFAEVLFSCKLGPIKSIHDEYVRRITDLKRKRFLGNFLKDNPGIQHKAGVPMGGTFIIVYHDNPTPVPMGSPPIIQPAISTLAQTIKDNTAVLTASSKATMAVEAAPVTSAAASASADQGNIGLLALSNAIASIRSNPLLGVNQDIRSALDVLGTVARQIIPSVATNEQSVPIIDATIGDMENGTVIADFYLPYQRSCDCNTVQFVLPKIVPTFSVQISCTDADGNAQVAVTPKGGLPPYSVKIGDNNYVQLGESFSLMQGTHRLIIRDADNIESEPQALTVPTQLTFGEERYINDFDKKTYQVSFDVTGGTAPYDVTAGTLDDANDFTSDIVESGTELTVDIADSVGCKVAKTFTHEVLRPTFTMELSCTNSDGNAQVIVTPQDGVAPYSIKIVAPPPIVRLAANIGRVAVGTLGSVVSPVPAAAGVDSQSYAQLVEPLILAQGSYSLTIRDSVGSESLSQLLTVPMPLTLGEPIFQCNDKYTAYTATFPIIGGSMPYEVNGAQLDGSSYSSEQIPSGKPISIEVTDANKCTAKAEATYTCVVPCGLPCNGIALQRGYRFWLPEPGAKLSYDTLRIIVNQFVLDIAPGKSLDLTADVQKILSESLPVAGLNKDFNGTVMKCMNVINDLIAKNIGNPDFLKLVYQSDPNFPGMLGMLLIEYFECLSFKFDMVSAFPHSNTSGKLRTIYEPIGTSFIGLISAPEGMQIPAIDGIRLDKCNPETKPTMLCQEPIDLILNVVNSVDPKRNVAITVTPVGKEVPVSLICELPDSFPFMSTGPIAIFNFNLSDFPVKQVRITAFTKKGCWVAKTYNIVIG